MALSTCCVAAEVQIEFKGVDKELEKTLRKNLSLNDPTELYLERARQEILLALQSYGYYKSEITSTGNFEQEPYKASFDIQLGPLTHIQAIHFNLIGEGEKDPALQNLRQEFPLNVGDVFLHEKYEQGKKTLLSTAIQNGYLDALFSEHRVEVNVEENTCIIYLTLHTQAIHHFGTISFSPSSLSTNLLNRYPHFAPGDVYSPEKTLQLQSELSQSQYFSQVVVKTNSEENSTIVPVHVELTDAKPNLYLLGAGYGTDTGVRGKLGWTRRQLNPSGHRFAAQAQIAEIYNKIEADYSIPGKHPFTDQIKFKVGFFEDEFSEKPSTIYEAGVTEEREIYGWQRQLALTYLHEQFNAFITNEKVHAKLIMPRITFIQTKRDDKVNPTKGRHIEITLRGSVDALISDTSFFQSYLQLRWLHAINPTTKALIRTELGLTVPDDSEKLPLSQRFFAGGDQSLRGFGYRSLPNEIDKDGNRQPVGGAYLAIGSIELEKTIKKPFGVFTFLDAGNAFRRFGDKIEVGTGVGVDWQTRLGPIKFAVAKPLTKSADSWRIHASFGPEL